MKPYSFISLLRSSIALGCALAVLSGCGAKPGPDLEAQKQKPEYKQAQSFATQYAGVPQAGRAAWLTAHKNEILGIMIGKNVAAKRYLAQTLNNTKP